MPRAKYTGYQCTDCDEFIPKPKRITKDFKREVRSHQAWHLRDRIWRQQQLENADVEEKLSSNGNKDQVLTQDEKTLEDRSPIVQFADEKEADS